MADFQHVEVADFSQFHPLDHWPYSDRCRRFPGGGWRHLGDAWHYHRREQVIVWIWKTFRLCPVFGHQWQVWHRREPDGFSASCLPCGARRPATAAEIAEFGPIPIFDADTKIIGTEEYPDE